MKFDRKSFGVKLWLYFILFAAIIFGALWLLQTVFLQSFYNRMAIRNVEKVALQIADQRDNADLDSIVDNLAYNNSLLIFLMDWQGNVLYSSDEHSSAYRENKIWHTPGNSKDNPHHNPDELLSWQIGAFRNLPQGYDSLLQKLSDSDTGYVGYQLKNNSTYVYGRVLPASNTASGLIGGDEAVLYISTPLGAVNATVGILRVQLVWVTLASLIVGFVIAFFISQRFARPVSAISRQAKRMAGGDFKRGFEKGFCSELDELSDTLDQTAFDLAQAENFRQELLANVSHDLRTPLTMIKGYAEMVRDISWEDEEKREADLAIIIREVDRLTGLVNEILEYSALQAGEQPLECEDFDISATARYVMAQFDPLCKQNGYSIESFIMPNQWVNGDRKKLERVLYNLIDNAISHTGNNRKIQVMLKELGTSIRIEVRDYGDGIPQDDLPHVWDRYFTAKQRRSDGNGVGLGLAIAKEILTAHQAKFGADSELGKGSMFWFELGKQEIYKRTIITRSL